MFIYIYIYIYPPFSVLLPSVSSDPNTTALALEMVTQWTKASSLKLKLMRAASTPILAMPSQRPTYWDLFSMKSATTSPSWRGNNKKRSCQTDFHQAIDISFNLTWLSLKESDRASSRMEMTSWQLRESSSFFPLKLYGVFCFIHLPWNLAEAAGSPLCWSIHLTVGRSTSPQSLQRSVLFCPHGGAQFQRRSWE